MKKISSILFITALFLTLPFLTAFADDLSQQQKFCEPVKRYKEFKELEYFKNIQGINIYVQVPSRVRDMFLCHGREDSCDEVIGPKKPYDKGYTDARNRQVEHFKAVYGDYPKELFPEKVYSLLSEEIRKILMFDQEGMQCDMPPIFNKSGMVSENPNILNIVATLSFGETTDVKFSILKIDFYRAGEKFTSYEMQTEMDAVIVLTGENIALQLKRGFGRAYGIFNEPIIH